MWANFMPSFRVRVGTTLFNDTLSHDKLIDEYKKCKSNQPQPSQATIMISNSPKVEYLFSQFLYLIYGLLANAGI